MKKIGIVGQGFVGNAIYQKFKNYYKVLTYDLDSSKCNSTEEETMGCDIVFVCLPTPMNSMGECDISIVDEAIAGISNLGKASTVVIKSTVVPGTTERLNEKYDNISIVFNPEFLTEANAVKDFENQNRIVLGGPRPTTTKIKRIYTKVFAGVHIIKTGSTHAEMIKYVTNTFLATKVSFANEIYQICEKMGLDYDKVIEYSTFDERLGNSHWNVPGPDGDFGYGGHCFPKDLMAMVNLARNMGVSPRILEAVNDKNNDVRNNRDWESMKGRAVS
jgi:nucleotide sugar dehydrogenase|tara:strand:- start:50 stop:874 length:825 start_codon:yes stop_codon:yes gene_type:complete